MAARPGPSREPPHCVHSQGLAHVRANPGHALHPPPLVVGELPRQALDHAVVLCVDHGDRIHPSQRPEGLQHLPVVRPSAGGAVGGEELEALHPERGRLPHLIYPARTPAHHLAVQGVVDHRGFRVLKPSLYVLRDAPVGGPHGEVDHRRHAAAGRSDAAGVEVVAGHVVPHRQGEVNVRVYDPGQHYLARRVDHLLSIQPCAQGRYPLSEDGYVGGKHSVRRGHRASPNNKIVHVFDPPVICSL